MRRGRCTECGEAFLSATLTDTCSNCAGEAIPPNDTDLKLRKEAVTSPKGRKQTLDVEVLRDVKLAPEKPQTKTPRKKKAAPIEKPEAPAGE